MGTISLTLPSDGSTAEVSDYNTPINTIKDEFNGNIDNDNIKANAGIAGSKLADSAVTTAKIATAAVTPVKWTNPYKFSAYASAVTTITSATQKVAFNTENFDSNNNYDSTTNYRYTVPVTGFYHIDVQVGVGSAGMGSTESVHIALYKNGSSYRLSEKINGSNDANKLPRPSISGILSLTAGDYLEVFAVMGGVYRDIGGGSSISWFEGFLVSET